MFSRGTKVNLRNIERKLLACPDIQVLYYNAYDILSGYCVCTVTLILGALRANI